jgi:hypothetical protein
LTFHNPAQVFLAGTDATSAFFELHRAEVLKEYSHLRIGLIDQGQRQLNPEPGSLSLVPYAEPTWLREDLHNPYYQDVSKASLFLRIFASLLTVSV